VPDWGGFVAQYRPARLDEARHLVHPPGKDLGFNRHLVRNDGLLADRIAKREGISFDDATGRIADEVAGWRSMLERTGRVELPRIGIFYRDSTGNLQFDPDRHANFLKDAHGLRPVAAVPVVRQEPAPARMIRQLPRPVVPAGSEKDEKSTNTLWVAAASVALLFGAATWWVTNLDTVGRERLAALLPSSARIERTYIAPTAAPASVERIAGFSLSGPMDGLRTITVPALDGATVTVAPEPVAASVDSLAVHVARSSATPEVKARFHVIAGCFADPANAERLLNDLRAQGFPAVRLPRNGQLHPVAFGSYERRADALSALATIRKESSKAAWLLVR
jgi:hypothetical protein